MLILSLSLCHPGFIHAQAEKAPPDEQKVVEWLAELADDELLSRHSLWEKKTI